MKASRQHSSITSANPQLPGTPQDSPASLACYRVISQTGFYMRLWQGGRLLKLAAVRDKVTRKSRPGEWIDGARASNRFTHGEYEVPESGWFGRRPRGKVRGFSRSSRMRLLEMFNQLNAHETTAHPKFITLTYPEDIAPEWKVAKAQLNTFLWYLEKRYGRHPLVWRMEHQENGSIHFHIIYWYRPFVPYQVIRDLWDGLICNYVLPEQSASTQVKGLTRWRQVAYYVAKYVAKRTPEGEADVAHGRHWGTRNWSLMPVKVRTVVLSLAEGYRIRRQMRAIRASHCGKRRHAKRLGAWSPQSSWGATVFAAERDGWRLLVWATGITKGEYLRAPPKVPTPG